MELRTHLRDNTGSAYIWFIFILMVFLIFVGAIYNIADTYLHAKDIRSELDNASSSVFADIREAGYSSLAEGHTFDTLSNYSDRQVAELLGIKLGATITQDPVSGTNLSFSDDRAKNHYRISNLHYAYVDRLLTSLPYLPGDITHDGKINKDDQDKFDEIAAGGETDGISAEEVDINKDSFVNDADRALLKALTTFYSVSNTEKMSEETSVALLMITFDLSTSIKYGTIDFGETSSFYSYVVPLTIKPADWVTPSDQGSSENEKSPGVDFNPPTW